MYDEIVVELMDATEKDLFFHGPTIMVQVLYALMKQVKMDHLSGGKCISKRPRSNDRILCTIMWAVHSKQKTQESTRIAEVQEVISEALAV